MAETAHVFTLTAAVEAPVGILQAQQADAEDHPCLVPQRAQPLEKSETLRSKPEPGNAPTLGYACCHARMEHAV
jgi:hypothetical protein